MSVSLILASQSKPRRDVLYAAGVCPTIRVSHVDEPGALEAAARESGRTVEELTVAERVAILATAKAEAVHRAYREVAATASAATGERVTAYPLRAAQFAPEPSGASEAGTTSVENTVGVASAAEADGNVSSSATVAPSATAASAGPAASDVRDDVDYSHASEATTRDFSGVDMPTETAPIDAPVAACAEGEIEGEGEGAAASPAGLTASSVGPLILGCDSIFLFEGECHGKPHSAEVARERLRRMRGASGELWTGHCLIDFATGRTVSGASRAVLHFGDFDDDDIERYIATGEPLEVAGSFTLEGFGGAFIDGIEGDPHGIIGLSLPLARRLAGELGVRWTDLWNVDASGAPTEGKAEGNAHAGITPPKENVRQPGDGWVDCACGRKHWGLNGASGVLLARRDEAGEVTHVVMQHRAAWSAEGGTWGIPGGATADGESTIEGALRESFEEANVTPEDIEVVGAYREEHGPWAYTTVFAFEKPGHTVHPRANDDESMEIEWVPIDEVPNRRLLTAMRTDWPRFEARLRALAEEHRGR